MRLRAIAIAMLGACGDPASGDSTTDASSSSETSSGASSLDGGSTSGSAADSSAAATSSDADDSTGMKVPDVGVPGFEPVRVVVISDLNDSYGSTTYSQPVHDAVDAIVALAPDLVLSTGDMVAGQQAGLDYGGMWAGFHAAVSDELATAGLPFAVTAGNHDASGYPAFAGEREIFVTQWLARKPTLEFVDDTDYPLRYSFTAGAALFVALDSTTVGALGAEQMEWLAGQLAQSDAPTKIVYGHVPLVPFAVGRETEIIGDPALEQLLEEHGVAMFVSGHHHVYYPGRRGSIRHVSMACLGSGPREWIGTTTTSPRAMLVFEIDAEGAIVGLDALGGAAFDTPIPRTDLPESITYGRWSVMRDDLAR
jgi:acid phosphatase type 7